MGLANEDKITVLKEQLKILQQKLSTSEGNITAGCDWGAKIKEERNQLQKDNTAMQTEMESMTATQSAIIQDAIQHTSADYENNITRLHQETRSAQEEQEQYQQAANVQHRSNNNLSQQNLQLKQQLQHHKDTAQLNLNKEDNAALKLCIEKDKRYDELLAESRISQHEEQRRHQSERDANNTQHQQELDRLKAQLHKAHTDFTNCEHQAHVAVQGAQRDGHTQHQAKLDATEARLQQQLQ